MTQATVTWGVVDPVATAVAMNDDAVSNLDNRYAVPKFGQMDKSGWQDKRLNAGRRDIRRRSNQIRGTVSTQPFTTTVGNQGNDAWWRRFFEQLERGLDDIEYGKRIALLIHEAETEAIEVNDGALQAFWSFIGTGRRTRLGYVFFTDDGDVSIEWRTDDENHFELRFLGNNRVNYVFFKREPSEKHVSVGHGSEVLSTIRQRIVASGFGKLVFS